MESSLAQRFRGVLVVIGTLWLIGLLNWLWSPAWLGWGILPRRLDGLPGILLSPWIHGDLEHLIANTIPLTVLLMLMVLSRREVWLPVIEVVLLSGLLLWLFGRGHRGDQLIVHVGASGVIYGLVAYLIVAGLRERRLLSLLVALLVGVLYGGTLLWGVLPTSQPISWEGHLLGAIAGAVVAGLASNQPAGTTESPADLLKRHGFEVE